MDGQDITDLTAIRLADLIRSRQVSASEVLETHLARIAAHNPRLNAVVTLDEEGARARARQADEALAQGEVWGPLHGVPMTLKDGHSTAGMRTTAGWPPLAHYVPQEDGTVAERLKRAGAIIVGKTNVSPLLMDIQSCNHIFGCTNNPWDVTRTAGGSSGGAAAALAVGMTPLEVGSDFAGSIRIPAHFCGVYGFKPTEGRVSMWGHIPDVPGAVRTHRIMWSIGPMARSVGDLALAFRVIAGPDGRDPGVPPVPVGEVPAVELRSLRLAWAPTFPGVPAAASIRRAVERLASELDRLGARVEQVLPEVDFGEMARVRTQLSRAVRLALEPQPPPDEPVPGLAEYLTALHRRDGFIAVWERFFEQWDALLCPVAMVTAFPHCPTDTPLLVDGEEVNYWRILGHCAPFNLTGCPAVVLPAGRDEQGLPIGVQVVSARWHDERLLGIAGRLAEVIGHA